MKTLYVTDLDGTLLNTKDRISEYSKKVINELIDEGMHFTYATARSLTSASVVAEGLRVQMPVIVYNGAFILNAATREVIVSSEFKVEEKQFIKDLLHNYQVRPLVYAFIEGIEKVSWIPEYENEGIRYYLNNREGDKRFRAVEEIEALYEGEVFYFTCIGEKEELLPIYEALKEHPNYNCVFQQELYREEYWCEIMPKKATKANAIKALKELFQYDRVIAFGDAINDIPMFEIADESYAVDNAVPGLKKLATGIIARNEEDGVAKRLKELIKNE